MRTLLLTFFLLCCFRFFAQVPAKDISCHLPPQELDSRGFGYSTATWPGQVVPYFYDDNLDEETINSFQLALIVFQNATNICFMEQQDEPYALRIGRSDNENYWWSNYIGMRSNNNNAIFIGPGNRSVILHEIGHAVGLYHEHQRPDRDLYITVNRSNVQAGLISNFNLIRDFPANLKTEEYDFRSIMHYNSFTFSNNSLPTITTKTGENISGGSSISALDIEMLNTLYPEELDCKKVEEERPPKAAFDYSSTYLSCRGAEIQLTSLSRGNVAQIRWRIPALDRTITEEENPIIIFDEPGSYDIILEVENEFGSSIASKNINILDSYDLIVNKVWPNPSNGQLTLEIGSNAPQLLQIEIMDRTGRLIYQEANEVGYKCRSPYQFNFPDRLPNDLYFVRFSIGEQVETLSVQLQR